MSVVINGKKYKPLNDKRRLLVQTDAIFNRALSLGYEVPDEDGKHAINNHIRDMIRIGIWDKLDIYFNFAYNNTTLSGFSLINWKNPSGALAVANGGVTYEEGGFLGNNTNGFIDTGFNPSTGTNHYLLNDACFGGVTYNSTVGGARPLIGVASSTAVRMYLNSSGNHRINTIDNLPSGVDMQGEGFKLMTRTSSTSIFLVNKSVQTTLASNSVAYPNNTLLFLRIGGNYGSNIISCGFAGAAITYNQSQLFRESYNNYLNRKGLLSIA